MTKLILIPYSLFLITLDYLDSDVLPFNFRLVDSERDSHPHPREYNWLGPDLTRNTQGRYKHILPVVLITPNRMV